MESFDHNEIIIRRTKLLETAFVAIKSNTFDCCKYLIVQFSGEDATDAGGPRREFLGTVKFLKAISHLPAFTYVYSASASLALLKNNHHFNVLHLSP